MRDSETPTRSTTWYAEYQDLTGRHIAELSKPRVRLPALVGLVGAAGIGLVLGRAIP